MTATAKRGRPRHKPGTSFGYLTVVADTGRTAPNGAGVYAVRCRCGAEGRVTSSQLGHTRKGVSAGCAACRVAARTKADRNAAVLAMVAATGSQTRTAEAFGVTPQRVSQIVRRAARRASA